MAVRPRTRTTSGVGSQPQVQGQAPRPRAEATGVRPHPQARPPGVPHAVPPSTTMPISSSSGDLPNWFWGLIGCLSVLVVGFAGLWWSASSGALASLGGKARAASPVAAAPRGPSGQIQVEQIASPVAPAAAPSPAPVAHADLKRGARPARGAGGPSAAAGTTSAAGASAAARPAKGAAGEKVAAAEKPAAEARENHATDDDEESAAAPEPPAKGTAAVRDVSPASAPSAANDSTMPAVLREISGPDDEPAREAAPKDVVEAALTALGPKVRKCFFKYQIPGRAQVRLVAPPAGGTAESVSVSGEFEGTPTGDCVAAEIGGAALPAFKGNAGLKVSHTYVLR